MKLFIYEHCPYCVRPRMLAGIKSLEVTLQFLANDDEQAHIKRIGKKQVPFLEKDDGRYITESLDICHYLNEFDHKPILAPHASDTTLVDLCNRLATYAKNITYIRFPYHPQHQQDFPTDSAKAYFINKKESYIGDFKAHYLFPQATIEKIMPLINQIDSLMQYDYASSEKLSFDDIIIFPILRSLTLAQDILTLPQNIMRYLEHISQKSGVSLYTKYDYKQDLL
ncbi:glutaredoxin 2 [Fangia hongkongensis]|uniref:glutaredoxin 2 n=1 Tax=Fangia hongkongensis TaxID=270495 RepID=UPI000475553E|nr:glutaredoxin 2 [Fangia hongkongensis]